MTTEKRTLQDLQQFQAMPLNIKIRLTQSRIRAWVNEFGEDGVYVSFSGGKDSTVLLHLVREMYPNIPAVFCDTGLEYPEIREFVKGFDNVEWIKPKKNFRKVIEDYGYPFISKEVSERVYYGQKHLTWWKAQNSLDRPTDRPTDYGIADLFGVRTHKKGNNKKVTIPDNVIEEFIKTGGRGSYKLKELYGKLKQADGTPSMFDSTRWKFLLLCPQMISNKCCDVMKKSPICGYEKRTGRWGMTATMASESRLRTQQWLQHGCNAFDTKHPISNPMSFWTEQDVLLYIHENKIPIASVYGEVVKDEEVDGQTDWGELGIFDIGLPTFKTTGCQRTGCMFCGFGCHLEKPGEGRFERMKRTHPKQYAYIMRPWNEGGLGFKDVIDWINENGDLNIRY